MEMIIHLPGVRILKPFRLHVYEITHLPFETFSELDADWADEWYYEKANPVFAIRRNLEYEPSEKVRQNLIMLIYYAILLGSGNEYPNPMLSVTYFQDDDHQTRRYVGAADRSFLLHNNYECNISHSQTSSIQEIYTLCQNIAIQWNDPIFLLLNILGDIYSQNVSQQYASLPLMVALETYLIGTEPKAKIISRMIDAVNNRLFIDASSSIREIYSWRSDILHGRETKFINANRIFLRLKDLSYALTIQALKDRGETNDSI